MALFKKNKPRFPTLAVIILVLAAIWLLNDLSLIKITVPWIPVILIVIAVGIIINRYSE
ncbi:Uncharacterised protein [uncultured archaeon]|nr:Uncharacterised protein [uncultured archaeon]